MAEFWKKTKRVVFIAYMVLLHGIAVIFVVQNFFPNFHVVQPSRIETVNEPMISTPAPTPLPVPSVFADDPAFQQDPASQQNGNTAANVAAPPDVLMIPVKGVKRRELRDTFADARSNGRTHDAIDIMAPAGTPVVAAADGEIVKFFDSVAGGTTIYQLSSDRRFIYYYAHLQRRAENLKEHDVVKRGTVIGYVGDTGNAGAGNYHLHFAISQVTDPKRFWSGTYIDPYPLLQNGIEAP